jgi:hypothetical protein
MAGNPEVIHKIIAERASREFAFGFIGARGGYPSNPVQQQVCCDDLVTAIHVVVDI